MNLIEKIRVLDAKRQALSAQLEAQADAENCAAGEPPLSLATAFIRPVTMDCPKLHSPTAFPLLLYRYPRRQHPQIRTLIRGGGSELWVPLQVKKRGERCSQGRREANGEAAEIF